MKQKPMTRAEMERLLEGMDKDEVESPKGWWETSEGAEVGEAVRAALLANDDLWRLKWTREKPTEPGWYWYRDAKITAQVVQVRYWIGYEERDSECDYLQMYRVNDFRDTIEEMSGEWCGPLEGPE